MFSNQKKAAAVLGMAGAMYGLAGCTERPIQPGKPVGITAVGTDRTAAQPVVDEFSLLLVIDDSISMADKQRVLQASLEKLRLVPGACAAPVEDLAEEGQVWVPVQGGRCPEGWTFRSLLSPARQAVITTSMEAGGQACASTSRAGHPLPEAEGAELEAHNGIQYLAQLGQVGEAGCGYEAPLEAMYRFLIDPEPPKIITTRGEGVDKRTVVEGIDEELLAARQAFLSPLSQLVIIVLTDEDDCSISDAPDAFRVASPGPAARGSAACEGDPESPCCRPCDTVEANPPKGCEELANDPVCSQTPTWSAEEDPPNLRCFDRKRRFGHDGLFPIERYVDALREPFITNRQGELVDNPLFAFGRTPDMVSVLLLQGTPWQLLSTDESHEPGRTLEFFPPAELESRGVWDEILGDPSRGVPPGDVHLVQSPTPRAGLPLPGAGWDPITGHEVVREVPDDLQYSCLFELPTPRDCSSDASCLCSDPSLELPLCRDDEGSYDATQRRSQAYPAPRLLEFARRLGGQAFLGSICPKHMDDEGDALPTPGFGYSDAVTLLMNETYQSSYNGLNCFLNSLPLTEDGALDCRLLEMHEGQVDCAALGRLTPPSRFAEKMRKRFKRSDEAATTVCEIAPFSGSYDDPETDLYRCAHELHPALESEGYCYIDPIIGLGNEELVSPCVRLHERRLRVIPQTLPHPLTITELYCDYGPE